jgi:hypothetical protein
MKPTHILVCDPETPKKDWLIDIQICGATNSCVCMLSVNKEEALNIATRLLVEIQKRSTL